MSVEILKLKAAAEAATSGRWVADGEYKNSDGNLLHAYVAHEKGGRIAEAFANCLVKTDEQCRANAHFIATANPPTILELIVEIERLRQVEAEGCKPESSLLHQGALYTGAAPGRALDDVEGCKPDCIFDAIANADDVLSTAQQELSNTVQRAFPVGSQLRVSISGGMDLIVGVTSHCKGWWRPGEFYAMNVETGKRQIYSHHQVLEVLP